MITTLDAQPQEWMEGDANVFHTIGACHFLNEEHIEYWIISLFLEIKMACMLNGLVEGEKLTQENILSIIA